MTSSLTKIRIRAKDLIRTLWRMERTGQFEKGLLELSENWHDPEFLPSVDGLSKETAAELYLRFASLLGYQGYYKKIKDSQLRTRDILTRVLVDFESLGDQEKAAECENHIALTYSRTGEFAEARTWLKAASARPLSNRSIHRLASIMYEMLIDVNEQRYDEILELYNTHEPTFREWSDDWIGASFYINAGVGLVESGRHSEALQCYEIARYRSERSSIWPNLGNLQNEIAHVYKSLGQFGKALAAVDRGIEVFRSCGEVAREGFLVDTKASIFLDERRLDEALSTIDQAIAILKDGENMSYLAEALATKAKILVWSDDFAAAVSKLFEAVEIARTYSGESFAKGMIGQFEQTVKEKNAAAVPIKDQSHGLETGDLALVLPPSLSTFERYQGIWINNAHLECVGIEKGSLAIAVSEKVQRGDLVAISEIESGEISCGFYDSDFGVVCLEGCGSEPQLFDKDSVRIIGKIVGVVRETDDEGRSIVVPVRERPSLPEV